MTVRQQYFSMSGGLNLVSPVTQIKAGELISCLNYEVGVDGGYTRMLGYERFSGQPSPTDSVFHRLNFDTGVTAITAGQQVTQLVTGATGYVLSDGVVDSGSFVTNDAIGHIAVGRVSGTFSDTDAIQVFASTVATLTNAGTVNDGGSLDLSNTYHELAIEDGRAQISAVTGSGAILGVKKYNDAVYAFRNNVGGTLTDIYKSTSAGWAKVQLGETIEFTAGTSEPLIGEVLTGGTSTETAQIDRVILQSGDWTTNDAEGYMVVSSVSGAFQAETGTSASGSLTLSGDSTEIELQPNGRYDFAIQNFGGNAGTNYMYGCDGVNNGFEFDGTVYTPIRTGMAVDAPQHVIAHKNHLFFSFAGGSLQHSATSEPLSWSVILGAAELALGYEITALQSIQGGSLAIYTNEITQLLYGSSVADWELRLITDDAGAKEWSNQYISTPIILADVGLIALTPTQAYGDFQANTFSQKIRTLLTRQNSSVIASGRVKSKNQYRLFFDDFSGITATFNNFRLSGFSSFTLAHQMTCVDSESDMFCGGDNGFIYQMEKGNSFDDEVLSFGLSTAFNSLGQQSLLKRFRLIEFDINVSGGVEFKVKPLFEYGKEDFPAHRSIDLSGAGGGGAWGAAIWGESTWGGQNILDERLSLEATSKNMSIITFGETRYDPPHTLHGAIIHFTPRRRIR